MKQYRYRNPDAQTVLIQLVGEHDLPFMEQEIKKIKALTDNADLYMIAVKVNDWNNDLSPWAAPPVFGKEPFGDGAKATLDYLQRVGITTCRLGLRRLCSARSRSATEQRQHSIICSVKSYRALSAEVYTLAATPLQDCSLCGQRIRRMRLTALRRFLRLYGSQGSRNTQ